MIISREEYGLADKITADGIIEACESISNRILNDIEDGNRWSISSFEVDSNYTAAINNSNRKLNAHMFVMWVLKLLDIIPNLNSGNFYVQNGEILGSFSARNQCEEHCDFIEITEDKTVSEVINDRTIQRGDIVLYRDIAHMNIYAGNSKWYDAGYCYCDGNTELSNYKKIYGGTCYKNRLIAYIIRVKSTELTRNTVEEEVIEVTPMRAFLASAPLLRDGHGSGGSIGDDTNHTSESSNDDETDTGHGSGGSFDYEEEEEEEETFPGTGSVNQVDNLANLLKEDGGTASNTTLGDVESIKRFYTELFNFNIKNNVFANGTIVVKGKASYKVGERIILEHNNMEYYVESVSHNFNCYGGWTTTLGVTRGIQPQNRFTPPWGMAEEFTPSKLAALIRQTSGEKIDWTNLPEVDFSTGTSGTSSSASDSSSATTTGSESSVYKQIISSWGFNTAAACAILANISAESSFNTKCLGDNGTSYGLCQWHNGRWNNLKKFCKKNNYKVDSVEGQIAFLKHELQSGYKDLWNDLKSAPNIEATAASYAYSFCKKFERPANVESVASARAKKAKSYFKKYKNG